MAIFCLIYYNFKNEIELGVASPSCLSKRIITMITLKKNVNQ